MAAIDKIIGSVDLTNQIDVQDYIWLVRLGIASIREHDIAAIVADPGRLSGDDIALLRQYADASSEQLARIREHARREVAGAEWREFFEPLEAKYPAK